MIGRTSWAWLRVALGAGILVVLLWRVGAEPFLDGVRTAGVGNIAAALAITALTTACCAWRWRVVARGLGLDLPIGAATAAYYRSQFLNATLPGGVLGDLHRAVRHGRDIDDLGLGLRSVVWERCLGQAVQVALTVAVLLALPSPMRPTALAVAAVGVLVLLVVAVLRRVPRDLHRILHPRRARVSIGLASALAAAGHTAIFLVAVESTGVAVPLDRMLPVALVVLLAAAVPTNVAGWGPREGAAAWAFGTVGLTAGQGVTAAVLYGVLALVATLPGAVVLIVGRLGRTAPASAPAPVAAARLAPLDAGHG
jgi:uncharacterized membrane protein YbhN (UPF0104 family)